MNLALVGAGGIGKTHLQNLLNMDDVRVLAICDPSPAVQSLATESGALYFDTLDAMLGLADLDAVIICTPTFLHAQQVTQVLASGRHCFCEKPLCLSSEQAQSLFDLAARQDRLLFVGHVIRFFEEYQLAADAIQHACYGRLLDAYLYRLTAKPVWVQGNWLFERDKSGLLPFDLHIHDLDFLSSVLGLPDIRYIQHGGAPGGHPSDDHYRILYDFCGTHACMEATWYEAPIPFTQGYRFYFERGLLCYDGQACTLYQPDCSPQVLLSGARENSVETHINVTPTNAYLLEMRHFLDCIRTGGPKASVRSEQVVGVLRVLERIGMG